MQMRTLLLQSTKLRAKEFCACDNFPLPTGLLSTGKGLEQHLPDLEPARAKGGCASKQIKAPHAAEALAVFAGPFVPPGAEVLVPGHQRAIIVAGPIQPFERSEMALHSGSQLLNRRQMGIGEYITLNPWVGRAHRAI